MEATIARISPWLAEFALLFVAAAWGSSYLGAKAALATLPVLTFLALRFGAALGLMLPFLARDLTRLTGREWQAGGILGVLLAVSIVVETEGILQTSPAHAGVLISMTILFVPLLEGFMFRGLYVRGLLAPAALSCLGCALLTAQADATPAVGDGLILVAAASRALHLVASKRIPASRLAKPGALTAIQIAVVAAATGVGTSILDIGKRTEITIDARTWMVILYMALVCTVLAFLIQLVAVQRTSATRVGLLLGTEPVFAALVAVGAGGDHMDPGKWAGVALIVSATQWGRVVVSRVEKLAKDPAAAGNAA